MILGALAALSTHVPVDVFIFVGSILEEVIAPIPSPFVLTVAGGIAHAAGSEMEVLFWLAAVGAVGKTLGAWVLYWIADRLEDVIVPRYGKYVGVVHEDIERVGSRMQKDWRGKAFLVVARALPFFPGGVVSIVAGIVKVERITYLWTSVVGSYVRSLLYLYIGYVGTESAREWQEGMDFLEVIGKAVVALGIAGLIAYIILRRKK